MKPIPNLVEANHKAMAAALDQWKRDVVTRLGDDERHERGEDVEQVNTGDAE